MRDFEEIIGFPVFLKGYYHLLQTTLADFLSADVELISNPLTKLKKEYGIDITLNKKREVYLPDGEDDNKAILVVRVCYKDKEYYLGVILKRKAIGHISKVLNCSCKALSETLNRCAKSSFSDAYHMFDESLVIEIIIRLVSVGYNPYRIKYLIRYFLRLRATTFEGNYFSSGLIVTSSMYLYKNKKAVLDRGRIISLYKRISIFEPINHRSWYLADGNYTYFLLDANQSYINDAYIPAYNDSDSLSQAMLRGSIKGRDLLFRVENGRDFSIITSRGIEIINHENVWHYRDYSLLKKSIIDKVSMTDEVFKSLMYFVLFCSKNNTSSILWILKKGTHTKPTLKTINPFGRLPINITDRSCTGMIKRFLTSDGATVIRDNGDVVGYGGIVDISKTKVKGVKGTGETAAQYLAKKGIAIKISQDGTIKVFDDSSGRPLIL